MSQIRPISELRNTNEISELCHNSKEPIFYEHGQAMMEVYKKLSEAETNLVNGAELLDADNLFTMLREEYTGK